MAKITLLLFVILLAPILSGKELILRPKAYLDVDSGKMIFNKLIKIEDQKIIAIEEDRKNVANVVDLKDVYLLPGLMDCHSHILFTQTLADNGFEGALIRETKLKDADRISRGKSFLKQYLKEGFTGLCDLGNSGNFLDVKLRNEIGQSPDYPMFYISGPGIAASKAQFAQGDSLETASQEYSIVDLQTNIDQLLTKYIDNNVDILKLYLDNSPGEGGLSEAVLTKIISNPKVKKFKKITFHGIEKSSFEKAVKFKLQNLEHANQIVLTSDLSNSLKFITATDQDSETLIEFKYYNKYFYQAQSERLKILSSKHINLVFGPDFYFHKDDVIFNRAQYVKRTLKTYIEASVPSLEIIRALTLNPAKSLGEELKIGRIVKNSYANLVGFKKNPLVNIEVLMETPLVINRGEILK